MVFSVLMTATQGSWKRIIPYKEISAAIAGHHITRSWKYGNLYCSQTVS